MAADDLPPRQLLRPFADNYQCRKCSSIFPIGAIKHHVYLDLKISASRGCPVCQFLFKQLVSLTKDNDTSYQPWISPVDDFGSFGIADFTHASRHFDVFSNLNEDYDDYIQTRFRAVASHALDKQCWSVILGWLSRCQRHHAICGSSSPLSTPPTRLLDIRGNRTCLVEMDQSEPVPPYATLSYCWGQSIFMSLSKSRYGQFAEGIDSNLLPKTLKDSIMVAQKLSIPYLWIDSLCVIHDDREDLAREMSQMATYYQDCVINISALKSPSADLGFLDERAPKPSVRLANGQGLRPAFPTWKEAFQAAPLTRRGWTLQERLLAPRVLHFGEQEVFWECRTASARECEDAEYRERGGGIEVDDESFKRNLDITLDSKQEMLRGWYNILRQYSTMQLTREQDIFNAIAGIARTFAAKLNYRYVAGLWEEDIRGGLLWYRHCLPRLDDPKAHISFKEKLAPSWSWASEYLPMKMLYGADSEEVDSPMSLKINFVNMPDNSFDYKYIGLHGNGAISFDAACLTVWCKRRHGPGIFNDPYLSLMLDIYATNGHMIGTGYLDCAGDRPTEENWLKLTALMVSQREDPAYEEDDEPIKFFLLVRNVEEESNDQALRCERVGIGQTADPFLGSVIISDFVWKRQQGTLV